VLYLLGVDPLRDVPDASLARRALENTAHVVVQSLELGSLEAYADAFLPAAAPIERSGSRTDWEGRSQPLHPVRPPEGLARPDWEILAGLARAMDRPLGFETIEALHEEAAPLLAPRTVPARVTAWTGTGPPKRLGELTLVSYPLLVDEGRMSEGATELKAALGEEAFVEVHPVDADKRGIVDGATVAVRTSAGEEIVPARVTDRVAPGAVFVPFNQPGLAANRLLSGSFTAAVEVEAVASDAAPAEGAA
jgi:formate dehydrogenase major subunit